MTETLILPVMRPAGLRYVTCFALAYHAYVLCRFVLFCLCWFRQICRVRVSRKSPFLNQQLLFSALHPCRNQSFDLVLDWGRSGKATPAVQARGRALTSSSRF